MNELKIFHKKETRKRRVSNTESRRKKDGGT